VRGPHAFTFGTNAVVAVDWAGVAPYFADRSAIDLLGKSDPVVARQPMHLDRALRFRFWPGHLKWDYQRAIRTQRPDVVVILTEGFSEQARPFLEADYQRAMTALKGEVAVRKERSSALDQSTAECLRARFQKFGGTLNQALRDRPRIITRLHTDLASMLVSIFDVRLGPGRSRHPIVTRTRMEYR
jgi:hypothetical protein